MFKYILAFSFVLFGPKNELLTYWKAEVIRREKFLLHRLIRERKKRNKNFLFWWRLANEMYLKGGRLQKKAAKRINKNLLNNYNCDIELGLTLGKNVTIHHHVGIVITGSAIIGENFTIRQNTTIGRSQSDAESECLHIGNNVDIGAHTFILGSTFRIGDNVKIGAMSFVNDTIPSNSTYITKKENRIINNEQTLSDN